MTFNLIKFIVLLLCIVFSFSCNRATQTTTATIEQTNNSVSPIEPSVTQNSLIDKILFINVECYKSKSGEDTCVLMNTIEANGKLKENPSHAHNHDQEINEYVCSLLSCEGKILYVEHIDNPLSSTMDTYEESGKIEKKQVNFERREFSLRVQKQETSFCKLKIEKKNKKGTSIICNTNLK